MNHPLVSIVIPCFNAARWLPATLDSALAQTWSKVEIIVVDDGSTDESFTLAGSFAARGVRVFRQENRGASAARNHGLRESTGEFVQFLDADDLLSPAKITEQITALTQSPPQTLASCRWGRFRHSIDEARFVDEAVFRDFAPLDFLTLTADTGAMMHPSAWLVPRALAERAGPWNESLSLNDDGEYFARVVLASRGIAFCAAPTARSYYRSGLPGSLSQQRADRARRSQFAAIELIAQHLQRAEDSPRTRTAAANLYQRFIHDFYPAPADLIRRAEDRVASFGGATLSSPAMGRKTASLAAIVGWKNVWRLKYFLRR